MLSMQSIQIPITNSALNLSAHGFSAHFGNGYAHGVLMIPEAVNGACEVRDQYDKEYIYQTLYRRGAFIDSNDPTLLGRHLPFLRAAKGEVMVKNVGLGGFLYRLVRKPGVTHITVVEPDFDILELIEPAFSKFADKITFVCGNETDLGNEHFDLVYDGENQSSQCLEH